MKKVYALEGSYYEYIVVGLVDGVYKPISSIYTTLDKAKECVDMYKSYEHMKDKNPHILARLVMAWEPLKEDQE